MWELLTITKKVLSWTAWLGVGTVPLLIGAAIIWFRPALLRPVLIGAGAWVGVFALITVVDVRATSRADARWEAKWKAAEAQAERDRLARDAIIHATIKRDAEDRIAVVEARRIELEQKVKEYEDSENASDAVADAPAHGVRALPRAAARCLTDGTDDKWLRDIQRHKDAKPKARGGLAERLRTFGR